MRLLTVLPQIRGERTVKEIAAASGVNEATIRQIEQGRLLPRDVHVEPLERAYGCSWSEWYSRLSVAAIQEGDGT